jgi:hypothetical protein
VNDYLVGAFEALSWVYAMLIDIDPERAPLDSVGRMVKEVEGALGDIRCGVAVDFRFRLRR